MKPRSISMSTLYICDVNIYIYIFIYLYIDRLTHIRDICSAEVLELHGEFDPTEACQIPAELAGSSRSLFTVVLCAQFGYFTRQIHSHVYIPLVYLISSISHAHECLLTSVYILELDKSSRRDIFSCIAFIFKVL